MKLIKIGLNLLAIFMCANSAFAQKSTLKLTDINLSNLSSFNKVASNWSIKGNVTGLPSNTTLASKPGEGILLNTLSEKMKGKREADLSTNFEHGDIYLELDFMLPKGSNSGIYLQGRYEIQLADSWDVKNPKSSDCGGIYQRWNETTQKGFEGSSPRINATFAPGLWQHLTVMFQAPKFDANNKKIANAKFEKIILNGVTIHENVILSGPTRGYHLDEVAKAPLLIQGDHGDVAFKNIQYAVLNDFDFKLKNLSFDYFDISQGNDKKALTPTRSGKADKLDFRLADNPDKFDLTFKAKFDVTESDEYLFTFIRNGIGSLKIDDQEIIKKEWLIFPDTRSAKIQLTPGEHSLELYYNKDFTWRPSALSLTVQKSNVRPAQLHDNGSMPDIPADPLITVDALTETAIQRSYWTIEGTKKYTHAISVGSPAGVHFAYNLNQGGIYTIWKGPFLRTTDMWFERGEPQTADAMGSIITLAGKCPVVPAGALPDTLDDRKTLIYKGYQLDNERIPSFQYLLNGTKIEDKISPNMMNNGLKRTVSINGTLNGLQYRLADGQIEELTKGVFLIDKKYYIIVPKELKPSISKTGSSQALVVQADGKKVVSTMSYEILW